MKTIQIDGGMYAMKAKCEGKEFYCRMLVAVTKWIHISVEQKKKGDLKMKTIQIDGGMYAMKAKCEGKEFYCRMLVAPISECATDNGYKVEYCDCTYMVGEESIPVNYDYDKKRIENKVATYLAISQFVEEENEKVNIIIGMPLEHWLDRQRRAEFEKYFKSNCIKLKVTKNGVSKNVTFSINDIKAFPETMGHLYLPQNQQKFKDITVGVLDCGGCNFQGAIYRNMVPIKESCFTSNKGVNFYLDEVKRAVNNKFGTNYQIYQIDDLIKRGAINDEKGVIKEEIKRVTRVFFLSVLREARSRGTNYQIYQIDDLIKRGAINDEKGVIKEEIKRVTRVFFLSVLREARSRNWMIEGLPIIVTGGGSCYFMEVINEFLHEVTFSENNVWDNVDGFAEIGGIIYGRKEITGKTSDKF